MITRYKYKVRGSLTSDHHITVWVTEDDLKFNDERFAVGHAAWLQLMENEKDQWGFPTDRPSATARVLRKLCEEVGSPMQVKTKFCKTIIFERIEDEEGKGVRHM